MIVGKQVDQRHALRVGRLRLARARFLLWLVIAGVFAAAWRPIDNSRAAALSVLIMAGMFFAASCAGGWSADYWSWGEGFRDGWRLGVESEHYFDEENMLNPVTGKPYGPGPLWAGTEPMDYPDPHCICGAPWMSETDECGRHLHPQDVLCGYPAGPGNAETLDMCGYRYRCTRPRGHEYDIDTPRRLDHSNGLTDWVWRTRLKARDAR